MDYYFKKVNITNCGAFKRKRFLLLNVTKHKESEKNIYILTELAFVGFGQGLPPPGPLQGNMINEILTHALNVSQ